MKVLLLNYEYPPLGGGAANATAYLLRELSGNPAVEIDVVTSSMDVARTERPSPNIRIFFLDIGKRGNVHYQSLGDLLRYSQKAHGFAKKLCRELRYDVCHAFFGIPCGFLARRLHLRYIVSLRGSDVPFYNERFKWLDRLFFRRLSIGIWRDATAVIANSEGLRALALETAPDQPIGVIPNGVDIVTFRPAERTWAELRVLCVSRLIARKGIQYLIRAIAQLPPNVRLTLAGSGNQEAALAALAAELGISDRVEFLGAVDRDAIADVYRSHDVFVLPSLNEGMSNTALEALACGLPLVMTDTGGATELLDDGKNGRVVGQRSVSDIAAALRGYADDLGTLRAHGRRSREVAESMSWARSADAYLELYRKAATGARV